MLYLHGIFKMPEAKNLYPEDGKKGQKTRIKTVFIASFSKNWQKKKTSTKMQTYFHFSYEKVMILSIHILYRIEINI